MARIGWTACGVCGNTEAAVSENATGTLSLSCHKCQFSGYAKPGTKAARQIRAAMTPDDDAASPTARAHPPEIPAHAIPAPPKKRAANSAFDLANL